MSNNLSNQIVSPETVGITTTTKNNDGKKKRKRLTPQEQIERYKQQQANIAKKIKDTKQTLREKERKNRTRDLIQIGVVVRKYVPDATTDSTAALIQLALAAPAQTDADIAAIGNAARAEMPSITPQQITALLKVYIDLFPSADAVRIDKSALNVIYGQRQYICRRLAADTGATATTLPRD